MATAVWQADTRETRFEETPAGEKAPFSAYQFVGYCLLEDEDAVYDLMDAAFDLMNLWKNPNAFVVSRGVENVRSLSVGDILHMQDGRLLQCAHIGWNEVEFDYRK